ncbi:rotamase-domain-containing protein [Fragilariopsis cylindrus CCMP1102]|uniref:Peptidyl-prolyl cis-trans isomerase n=1 Tax=Fragilariopsis cylindrus CCMP1102 TaxID=635003 RepID=A0A1E7FGI7_9STRA|nr:rotamase-domain-containing protein [Fragilariopsis cylindrus CCMP1102]|eukprot:OEU17290.1 rotamase-domain-containing protein [Fragilariopsis cylindrus CCMP1102]
MTVIALFHLTLLLIVGLSNVNAFQSAQHTFQYRPISDANNHYHVPSITTTTTTTTTTTNTRFLQKFTTKASASHILIKGGEEAADKLEEIKAEIDDSPVKFAKAAAQYSQCPSASKGGDLGEFGPGSMVKEFDAVVFTDPINTTIGPIKTSFGYHLIYVRERTE